MVDTSATINFVASLHNADASLEISRAHSEREP